MLRRITTKRFIHKLYTSCPRINNFSSVCSSFLHRESFCYRGPQTSIQFCRYKSKNINKSKKSETETETEESDKDFMDDVQDKYTKTVKINVTSMRLDVILKTGLGLSRNKLESVFYESKIRLNGEKLLKKSIHVQEGDEIDIIKGSSINNKDFLTVARVEILTVTPRDENINVKLRRSKSLTVENYDGNNRFEE